MLVYICGDTKNKKTRAAMYEVMKEMIETTVHTPVIAPTIPGATKRELRRVRGYTLKRCDAILMPIVTERNYEVRLDSRYARALGKEVFHKVSDLPEENYPRQFEMFDRLIQEMGMMHRRKNRDYSAQNISASGSVGIISRILDKVCRILSLEGWDVSIKFNSIGKPRLAEYESIVDAYKDLSVYSNIAIMWKENVWGK